MKTPTKFTFNSGRLYTEAGQVIHVEIVDGRLWFHDESRMVSGSFEYHDAQLNSEREIRELVMFLYDRGQYRNERPAPMGAARRIARFVVTFDTLDGGHGLSYETTTAKDVEAAIEDCKDQYPESTNHSVYET